MFSLCACMTSLEGGRESGQEKGEEGKGGNERGKGNVRKI